MPCKIALIDSGINLNLYQEKIVEFIDFENEEKENDNFIDDVNGHGTLCCSTILKTNCDVELIAVKVLDESNRCSSETLLSALEQLIEMDVNIINLSLCTSDLQYVDKYRKLVDKLMLQKKIIVAAKSNKDKLSIPAILPKVIGITGNKFLDADSYWYNNKKNIQCVSDYKAILLQGANGKMELFGGNSKATALMTGIISKLWNELKGFDYKELDYLLQKKSKKRNWTDRDIVEEKPSIRYFQKDSYLLTNLEKILLEFLKIPQSNKDKLYREQLYNIGIDKYNAIDIIQVIEDKLNIKIDYSMVNEYWFYSLDFLCFYIFNEKMRLHNE